MELFNLLGAFGGGIFGAAIGGTPAFVLTGIVAIAGAVAALAGVSDVALSNVAFGTFLGPNVAFAGAVAAAAYAARKKIVKDGADINRCLHATGRADVLLIGGLFGVLGFLVEYLYNSVLHFNTDCTALTVTTLGVVCRFLFGKTGLIGKPASGKKNYFGSPKEMLYAVVMGAGVGFCVSGVAIRIMKTGVSQGNMGFYANLVFGISAVSLLMILMGLGGMATHHITLPTALATIASGNIWIGTIVGIICSVFGEFVARTFNTDVDSHIDPPAVVIATMTFLINTFL